MNEFTIKTEVIHVETDRDGTVRYYDENSCLHNPAGPASEYRDGTRLYYIHGKIHREDGAAIEWPDGRKEYWINDRLISFPEFFSRLNPEQKKTLLFNLARGSDES